MKLYIENMVCLCCKKVVAIELNKMDLIHTSLELGEVKLLKPITKKQRKHLKKVLHEYGQALNFILLMLPFLRLRLSHVFK